MQVDAKLPKAASIWPSGVHMPGYALWVVQGCPKGFSPFANTPTPGVRTCGNDSVPNPWADANTHPGNPKC